MWDLIVSVPDHCLTLKVFQKHQSKDRLAQILEERYCALNIVSSVLLCSLFSCVCRDRLKNESKLLQVPHSLLILTSVS